MNYNTNDIIRRIFEFIHNSDSIKSKSIEDRKLLEEELKTKLPLLVSDIDRIISYKKTHFKEYIEASEAYLKDLEKRKEEEIRKITERYDEDINYYKEHYENLVSTFNDGKKM